MEIFDVARGPQTLAYFAIPLAIIAFIGLIILAIILLARHRN